MPENFDEIYESWIIKEITAEEAAKACNTMETTFYRWVRKKKSMMEGASVREK